MTKTINPEPRRTGISPRARVIITVSILGILFLGGLFMVQSGMVTPQDVRDAVSGSGDAKYIFFFLSVAFGTCIHIPSNLFIVAGAILFGAPTGAILTLTGGTFGALIQFLIIRRFLGRWERTEIDSPMMQKALAMSDKYPWRTIFILRICFHLSALVSAGLASTRVHIIPYLLGTLFGAAPLVFLFSFLATSLESVLFP